MVEKYKKEVAELELRRREIAKLQQYNNPQPTSEWLEKKPEKPFLDGKDVTLPNWTNCHDNRRFSWWGSKLSTLRGIPPLKITDIKGVRNLTTRGRGEFYYHQNLGMETLK